MDVKLLLPVLCILGMIACSNASAQSAPVVLSNCGQAYIDPQDNNNGSSNQNRDTLLYTEFFSAGPQRYGYLVDVNAFGGQQVDRVEVLAILPDSSRKSLGQLSFGNCLNCVNGFALLDGATLLVEEVSDINTMNMWIQSQGQPDFALPGNLQTLAGVGRLSGEVPFCAIGWEVAYSVYSDPGNASTEFSTYIHCLEPLQACPVEASLQLNCNEGLIEMSAVLPDGCFADGYTASWSDGHGWQQDGTAAERSLDGNEGWYYFRAEDDCCTILDSFRVENPDFADAGPDVTLCEGEPFQLAGTGGQGHFWTSPSGQMLADSLLVFTDIGPDVAGRYILHAFNEAGCEDTDTLQLSVRVPPLPQPALSGSCVGDTLELLVLNEAAFAETNWFTPLGPPLSSPVLPDFQPSQSGFYTLQGIDSLGCTAQSELLVEASPPPPLIYTVEETCDTAFVYFGGDGLSYEWEGNSVSQLATATGGAFLITVEDSLGCTAEETLEIPEPDGPEVQLLVDQPVCPGERGALEIVLHSEARQAIFSLDGGERYTLNDEFKNLQPGDYQLLVRDALDCIQTFNFNIQQPDSMGVALNYEPIVVRPTTPVELQATTVGDIVRYQWVPDEIDSGAERTTFEATGNMDIRVIVEDARGCLASAALPLTVELGPVYAPSAFSPNGDGRNDRFTVFSDLGSGEVLERLEVYDRWGGLVYRVEEAPLNDLAYGWDGTRMGEPLNAGLYAFYALVRYPNGYRRVVKGDIQLIR